MSANSFSWAPYMMFVMNVLSTIFGCLICAALMCIYNTLNDYFVQPLLPDLPNDEDGAGQ